MKYNIAHAGVTLKLKNESIPTNGSKNILITSIGNTNIDALICQSEVKRIPKNGNWYLHRTNQSIMEADRIMYPWGRGWQRNRAKVERYVQVRLWRPSDKQPAVEGVFTCVIPEDMHTTTSVGIYYPSELIYILISTQGERHSQQTNYIYM